MKVLNKKIYREIIRTNKFRSAVIIVTVMLTVGFLFGLANTEDAFYASFDKNIEEHNIPEARLFFQKMIDENNLTVLQNNDTLLEEAGVQMLEGRIYLQAQAEYDGEFYEAIWVALNSSKGNPNQVDQLRTLHGRNYFEGNNSEALLNFQFAESLFGHNVKVGESVKLSYGSNDPIDMEVVGTVQTPEYTYVVDPQTKFPMLGSMAIVYTSLEFAWDYLGMDHVINQILVDTVDMNQEAADEAVGVLQPALGDMNAPVYNYYSTWDSPEKQMFDSDAGVMDKFSFVLGGFALVIGIVLVYNSLTKLINAQRKHIGLIGAMGGKRRTIMFHYTMIGSMMGLVGVILGIGMSFGVSYLLTNAVVAIYGFKYVEVVFNPLLFAGGTLITLTAIVAFSGLSCLPVLQITPREAMTATYTRVHSSKRPLLEKLLGNLPSFRSISSKISLRELFMNKKRSSLTIIAVAVSSVILIVSAAMLVDMGRSLDHNYNVYNTYDGRVVVEGFSPSDDLVSQVEGNFTSIDVVEPFIYLPIGLSDGSGKFLGYREFEAVPQDSVLRDYNIIKGEKPTGSMEVVLGRVVADELDINVGDTIKLHLNPGDDPQTVKVVGLVGELLDVKVLTYIESINSVLPQADVVNGVQFSMVEGESVGDIDGTFYELFEVSSLENSQETRKAVEGLIEVVVEIISVFILLGVAMTMIFSFNTMYLAFVDREMEYLSLRAQGMKRKTLFKVLLIESGFLGAAGYLLAIPISYVLAGWGFDYILENRWYVEVFFPPELWIGVFVLSFGSVMLATIAIVWRIIKASMPDMLRNRQIS